MMIDAMTTDPPRSIRSFHRDRLAGLDRIIATTLGRISIPAMRAALAVVFILFGLLKPLGLSPAEGLVLATVDWVPIVGPRTMLHLIGWWEVLIGVCFLYRPLIRVGIGLLVMQMGGTFLPLVVLPEVCFVKAPLLGDGPMVWTLTVEAQYIIKNLLILAGAAVVGGTVRMRAKAD